ncbi:GNAT family N-acetyltransferase [Candidatus Sumerlaeota bacterium]|nr:GNAT family N-acetyltransferase [Candidatus Sumerlaeota bacterium]
MTSSESTSSSMRVRPLTEADDAAWETALAESCQASPLQWLPWLRCVGRHVGEVEIIGVEREGKLIAGLAGMVTPLGGARRFSTIGLTAYHGLWIRDAGLRSSRAESLLISVVECLIPFLNERYVHWAFANAPELGDPRPFKDIGCQIEVHCTYRVPLGTADEIMALMETEARRWARRAEREGATFEVCESTEETFAILEQHARATAERHGMGEEVLPAGFIAEVARTATGAGIGQVFLARNSAGEPVTSCLCLWDSNRAFSFLGGSATGQVSQGEVRFLDHRVFSWLHERGHREVDVLGGNIPELRNYKKRFNGPPVAYFTISRPGALPQGRMAHLRAAAKHLIAALRGR